MADAAENDRVPVRELEYLASLAAKIDPGSTVGIRWDNRRRKYSAVVEFEGGFESGWSGQDMGTSLYFLRRYLEMRVEALGREERGA